jgi:hypothetical protein
MSHRAQQIIDAMALALGASTRLQGAKVFTNRSFSLLEASDEVPCASVNYGADQPLDPLGASNLSFLDSLIEVPIVSFVGADDEPGAMSALMDMRAAIHVALLADQTQGLSFIINTRYGGATEPALDSSTQRILASLKSSWFVHYRMNLLDPS